jgi:hypothetical protein
MPGLVPGIHVLTEAKTWMAGTSPATTGGKAPENNGRIMSQTLRHDPEKWIPVFRKDHAQTII